MASKKYIDPTLTLVPYQIEALRCARHYVYVRSLYGLAKYERGPVPTGSTISRARKALDEFALGLVRIRFSEGLLTAEGMAVEERDLDLEDLDDEDDEDLQLLGEDEFEISEETELPDFQPAPAAALREEEDELGEEEEEEEEIIIDSDEDWDGDDQDDLGDQDDQDDEGDGGNAGRRRPKRRLAFANMRHKSLNTSSTRSSINGAVWCGLSRDAPPERT